MKLQQQILDQLKQLFQGLSHKYTFHIEAPENDKGAALREMIQDFVSTSEHLSVKDTVEPNLKLDILKDGAPTGISFRANPGGHEFNSLILAILNLDGKGKNLPDDTLRRRIEALRGPIHLTTYASLTCTNCPDVVQALNIMAILNADISHEMVDGALYQKEVEEIGIAAVPTVYADGKELHVGKSNLGELLMKLEEKYGKNESANNEPQEAQHFDLVVIGGGPAGVTSAIYSARKGLKVAIIAEKIGGQVNETTGIENLPSVVHTTGSKLAGDLKQHADEYKITILEGRKVELLQHSEGKKVITTAFNETITCDQVIIATGASWRRLGIEGEAEHVGKGVAFCPHCDGPFFKGKDIAVIGGGNSGIEAAIDLAGICKSVLVVEFMDTLKADQVLQEKLATLDNVRVIKSAATHKINGNGQKIHSITLKHRADDRLEEINLDGVFIQIGLSANTAPFKDSLETNRGGEIVIDERCRTNQKGIYAAGDCTTVPYKQIVIAMGEGAKAALTAFDDRMRGDF